MSSGRTLSHSMSHWLWKGINHYMATITCIDDDDDDDEYVNNFNGPVSLKFKVLFKLFIIKFTLNLWQFIHIINETKVILNILSAYEVKNNLCLFERPFKIQKQLFWPQSLFVKKQKKSPFVTSTVGQRVLLGTEIVPILS